MVPCSTAPSPSRATGIVRRLRAMAPPALAQMYRRDEKRFAFRVAPAAIGVAREGTSRRYTAISLLGLTADGADLEAVTGTDGLIEICDRLVADLPQVTDLGEAALIAWAAHAVGHPESRRARRAVVDLAPAGAARPTVESAWALVALTVGDAGEDHPAREQLADRLARAFDARSRLFSHMTGERARGLRTHVCCFADQVYPIFALSLRAMQTGSRDPLAMAEACAAQICARQGAHGQWWWHYDHRTGSVVEEYPVYAIHQDAMAPMALFALEEAGGASHAAAIERGLAWLESAPELGGGALIDDGAGMVWRKVARHEPGKTSRYLQAAATHLRAGLRAPGVGRLFPPGAIDREDRPYHWGWFLYAWAATRSARRLLGDQA